MFDDLISTRLPPPNRVKKTIGEYEEHFTEAAVMLAFAFNLLHTYPDLEKVEIHPDGEHGKRFDIRSWLEARQFRMVEPEGKTSYGGLYSDGKRSVYVSLKPGIGDVCADLKSHRIVAECKGGVINTQHPGQKSRLRSGLCEVVGLLMSRPVQNEKQYAVVPLTAETKRLAGKMSVRCKNAGIKICLLRSNGTMKSAIFQ